MIIADLLLPERPTNFRSIAYDPLVEPGALLEAQVLGVRVDALNGVAGVLMEMRVAMHMRESNTGVLVAAGVEDFRWDAVSRHTDMTAWTILDSAIDQTATGLGFKLECYPDATLSLSAAALTFYSCDVSAIGNGPPPDYSDGYSDRVRSSLAGWHSEIDVVSGSSLERA